jgi:hypothetical protein
MGERNGRTRLTDGQCLAMWAEREEGAKYRDLAARYGVALVTAWNAVHVRAEALRSRSIEPALRHFLSRPPWT